MCSSLASPPSWYSSRTHTCIYMHVERVGSFKYVRMCIKSVYSVCVGAGQENTRKLINKYMCCRWVPGLHVYICVCVYICLCGRGPSDTALDKRYGDWPHMCIIMCSLAVTVSSRALDCVSACVALHVHHTKTV